MEIVMSNRTFEEEYKPITAWGYIGYQLLFCIPVVGLLLVIGYSLGARNKNLRNFARAEIVILTIEVILIAISAVLGAG